jgi:hypothetical protein
MILATVYSINDVPIRLTDERWEHIVDQHPYMTTYFETLLAVIEDPEYILRGYRGTLIAVRTLGRRKYLHTIYRERSATDGFIVTAYIKSKLNKHQIIWRADDQ